MSYHFRKKRKRRLQRGEKLVLKYGIPAAIVMAILIQITVRGVPAFFDRTVDFLNKEAWRSRQIIAGHAAKKGKDANFRTEKNFQANEDYELGASRFSSNPYNPSNEIIIEQYKKIKKNQRDTDDAIYQEIQRRELKEEIDEYQKIFEEEE